MIKCFRDLCAVRSFSSPLAPAQLTLRSPGPGLGHLPSVLVGDCRSRERLVGAWLTLFVRGGGGVRGCQPEQIAGLETAFLDCIERTSNPDPGQIQRHACPSRGLCGDTCTPGSCWRHPCPACAQRVTRRGTGLRAPSSGAVHDSCTELCRMLSRH